MLSRAFKAPAHVSRLDALLEVYPDAYIVWMHRDPLWVTTSYTLLLALFKRMNEDATSEQIAAFGPVVAARLKELIDEAMRVQSPPPPHHIKPVALAWLTPWYLRCSGP